MRYLITGGAGFIGCNAAARFAKQGDEVMVADNLSRRGSADNARWLQEENGVRITKLDLRQADPIAALVAKERPDVVLHCAGQVAVTTSVTDPRSDFEDNALGTFNVLEAVRNGAPEAVVLYTSTNKVYGGMEDVGVELRGERVPVRRTSETAAPKSADSTSTRPTAAPRARRISTCATTPASTACAPSSSGSRASTGTASSASRTRAGWPGSPSARCSASR